MVEFLVILGFENMIEVNQKLFKPRLNLNYILLNMHTLDIAQVFSRCNYFTQKAVSELGYFTVRTFIGAIADENLPLDERWSYLNGDTMTYSNWKDDIIPTGAGRNKCAYMSSYDGVWGAQHSSAGNIVCKIVLE